MVFSKCDKFILVYLCMVVFYLVYRANHPYINNFSSFNIIVYNLIVLYPCFLYYNRLMFYMSPSRLTGYAMHSTLEYKWFYDDSTDIVDKCYVRVATESCSRNQYGYYYGSEKEYSPWYMLDSRVLFNNEFIKFSNMNEFARSNGTVDKLRKHMLTHLVGDKSYGSFRIQYDTEKVLFYLFSFIVLFAELIIFLGTSRY